MICIYRQLTILDMDKLIDEISMNVLYKCFTIYSDKLLKSINMNLVHCIHKIFIELFIHVYEISQKMYMF